MSFSAMMTMEYYTLEQLQEGNRAAMGKAIRYWHKYMMPRHFTVAGGRLYGYQKRKGDDQPPRIPYTNKKTGKITYRANQSYSWKKRRRMRHNKPLVYTGQAERMAKRQLAVKIVRDRKNGGVVRGKGVMDLPPYFYKYRKDQDQPDKYAELTRTTEAERSTLLKVYNEHLTNHLRSMPVHTERKRVA